MAGESDKSVTEWIAELKRSSNDAARRLYERYFDRLAELALRKLGDVPRTTVDEEDVVQSVFRCLKRGATRGRFPKLDDRNDLWQVLLALTNRKAIDQIKRLKAKKRGGGHVILDQQALENPADSSPGGVMEIVGREPTPDEAALR